MLDCSREELTAAVDAQVDELLEVAGCAAPPVDVIRLARQQLGMEIVFDGRQTNRGRAQRVGGKRLIYLRPEPTPERQQWTVAHEIGEHLRPALFERLGLRPTEVPAMAGESLANLLAQRLLVPQAWLIGDAPAAGHDLLELKERYRSASHEVLALRLLDLPAPCVITILDNNHVTRRRSNAWPVNRQMLPLERECQEYVNYYSRQRMLQRDDWTVTGWPVHKLDWKREILRSVFEE